MSPYWITNKQITGEEGINLPSTRIKTKNCTSKKGNKK